MTDVAAIIGNYQGEHLLPECLASLRAQTQLPVEVIVVDASSSDESVAVAERQGARVLSCANRGLGYLYNRGAEAATAPYVLFLNNDVALEAECIARLAAALNDNHDRFAADARQLDWTGQCTIHARTTLTRGRLLREHLPGLHLNPNVPADDIADTVCANGAAMLVRREAHLEIGGFDETFFMEWEDLDLCWRAWLCGKPTVYVPAAVVRHRVGGATPASARARRKMSSHHNLVRFALKSLPADVAARVLAGELLRLPRHPVTITRAMFAIAGEARQIFDLRRASGPSSAVFQAMLDDGGATLGRR